MLKSSASYGLSFLHFVIYTENLKSGLVWILIVKKKFGCKWSGFGMGSEPFEIQTKTSSFQIVHITAPPNACRNIPFHFYWVSLHSQL